MTPVATEAQLSTIAQMDLRSQPGHATFRPLIDVGFKIVVTNPDGSIASEECKAGGDLATNNFIAIMVEMWTAIASGGSHTFAMSDTGGASRTFRLYSAAPATNGTLSMFCNGVGFGLGPVLAIGNGSGSTVTPARTDTNLVQTTASGTSDAPASGGGIVTFAKAFVNSSGSAWTGATAIREVGMIMSLVDQSQNNRNVLMLHDAITATTVNNGQTITVTYTVTFP